MSGGEERLESPNGAAAVGSGSRVGEEGPLLGGCGRQGRERRSLQLRAGVDDARLGLDALAIIFVRTIIRSLPFRASRFVHGFMDSFSH